MSFEKTLFLRNLCYSMKNENFKYFESSLGKALRKQEMDKSKNVYKSEEDKKLCSVSFINGRWKLNQRNENFRQQREEASSTFTL